MLSVLSLGARAGCAVNPVSEERHLMLIDRRREPSPPQLFADVDSVRDQPLNDNISSLGMEPAQNADRPDMPYSSRAVRHPISTPTRFQAAAST